MKTSGGPKAVQPLPPKAAAKTAAADAKAQLNPVPKGTIAPVGTAYRRPLRTPRLASCRRAPWCRSVTRGQSGCHALTSLPASYAREETRRPFRWRAFFALFACPSRRASPTAGETGFFLDSCGENPEPAKLCGFSSGSIPTRSALRETRRASRERRCVPPLSEAEFLRGVLQRPRILSGRDRASRIVYSSPPLSSILAPRASRRAGHAHRFFRRAARRRSRSSLRTLTPPESTPSTRRAECLIDETQADRIRDSRAHSRSRLVGARCIRLTIPRTCASSRGAMSLSWSSSTPIIVIPIRFSIFCGSRPLCGAAAGSSCTTSSWQRAGRFAFRRGMAFPALSRSENQRRQHRRGAVAGGQEHAHSVRAAPHGAVPFEVDADPRSAVSAAHCLRRSRILPNESLRGLTIERNQLACGHGC